MLVCYKLGTFVVCFVVNSIFNPLVRPLPPKRLEFAFRVNFRAQDFHVLLP